MNTEGLWGIICLAAFVIVTVLVFKFAAHAIGANRIAALV